MRIIGKLTFWTLLLMMYCTVSYNAQNLNSFPNTCFGPDNIDRKLNDLENKMVQVTSTISKIETKIDILERKTDRGIAFTTQLEHGESISNIKKHQKIVFAHVISNHGNAYDKNTGTFNCPKKGIYGFYYNLSTEPSKFALVELAKNGVDSHAIAFSEKADGSTFVVLSLVKGDRIWLRASRDCSTGEVIKYQENTFSGFLLHAF